jgi:lipoprotein-anchoring transpeptidase ErfK/SrfK
MRPVFRAMVIELAAHRLTLYDQGRKVADYPVGVGTATNPTPTGTFYVIGVIRPNPSGPYGPYAIGTSAFSETLTDWPGGGVVGIHGTNDPSSVGRNVSHGCVRMNNDDITELAPAISPGTPIFIRP